MNFPRPQQAHRWRIQGVFFVLLSAIALSRLLLPDLGGETVPGPFLLWLDRLWGWWAAVALVTSALGTGRLITEMPLLRYGRKVRTEAGIDLYELILK